MGKKKNLSELITPEFESLEGVHQMLEKLVSGWAALQKQLIADGENKEDNVFDQILVFLNNVDDKIAKGETTTNEEIEETVPVITSLQKMTDRINKQYDVVLNPYFKKKAITEDQEVQITILDFTKLLVLVKSLLLNYDLEEQDEEGKMSKKIFLDGKLDQKPFGIKNFLVKTIGKFLVLANNNIKEYADKDQQAKLTAYKKEFLADALFLIFNVSWLPKERTYKNTLILNLLQTINWGDDVDDYGDIMAKVLANTQKVKNLHPNVVKECTSFHDYTLPKYLEWKKLEIKDRSFMPLGDVEEYHILFAKKLGFFTVDTIQSNGNSDIVRAGYPVVDGHFVWENVPMGDKSRKKVVYQ